MENNDFSNKKIAVIGLDGGSFQIMRPMMEKGMLPNLKKIMDQGASGGFMSTIPPLSPQAWASFMTGKNPGKHGIYDFTSFKKNSYEMTFSNGSGVKSKTLWRFLSECGYSVGVVNVPMTYPAEEVNGYLLSGFEAPSVNTGFSFPAHLSEEIKAATGKAFDLHGDFWTQNAPEVYLQQILTTMNNQAEAVKYLVTRYPTDFFMYVFGSTDRAQHYFWKYQDPDHPDYKKNSRFKTAIEKVYCEADRLTGEILAKIPDPKTVFVVSDHGFGPLKKIVYLDQWLENNGYLVWKQKTISRKNAFLKQIYMAMRLYLPQKVKDLLKAMFPGAREKVESSLILGDMDWEKTKAFAVGVESTSIYINRRHRFPSGTIDYKSDEYEQLLSDIITGIMEIRDPDTEERVAEKVLKTCDIYSGAELESAPDLIVLWKDHEYVTRRHYRDNPGEVVSKQLKSGVMGRLMSLTNTGCHRPEGIFMASGAGIKESYHFDKINITDFFTLLLHYLGRKPPQDVDGQLPDFILKKDAEYQVSDERSLSSSAASSSSNPPLNGKFSSPRSEYRSAPGCEELSREEAEAMSQRLKNLGYLE